MAESEQKKANTTERLATRIAKITATPMPEKHFAFLSLQRLDTTSFAEESLPPIVAYVRRQVKRGVKGSDFALISQVVDRLFQWNFVSNDSQVR